MAVGADAPCAVRGDRGAGRKHRGGERDGCEHRRTNGGRGTHQGGFRVETVHDIHPLRLAQRAVHRVFMGSIVASPDERFVRTGCAFSHAHFAGIGTGSATWSAAERESAHLPQREVGADAVRDQATRRREAMTRPNTTATTAAATVAAR
jgi:hypothetical protein